MDHLNRPLYSFNFVQSGENVVFDACVPAPLGFQIAQLVAERSLAPRIEESSASKIVAANKTAIAARAKGTAKVSPKTAKRGKGKP
jgi:hypothetical protein